MCTVSAKNPCRPHPESPRPALHLRGNGNLKLFPGPITLLVKAFSDTWSQTLPLPVETFSENLQKLINKFEADKSHHLSKDYSEAQARVDFITPLFKLLGWDVENEAGLPHGEREVIVERGETEGRPDYNFRIGGQTKFFVEAKAPSEELDAVRHILQAKGYAWNTKQVFFVILTDFEEFFFCDASIKGYELATFRWPSIGLYS